MTVTFPDEFNLADYFLFDRLEEGLGDKVAIRYGEREYTYGGIARRSKAFAGALADAGVMPEQRVYIVLPDTPPFAWALYGTLARGAVVAMGNPASPVGDLSYVVDYARAAAVVTTPEVAAKLRDHFEGCDFIKRVFVVPDVATGEDPESAVNCDGGCVALADAVNSERPDGRTTTHRDDVAIWLFTSGSTGRPKAAVHSHRDFAFNTEVYAKGTVGYRQDDVTVSVPRLFFGYATGTNLWFPHAVGATVGLFSERATPESLAHAITMYKPTVVTNVPTMIGKLLEHDDKLRKAGKAGLDFSNVRFQLSAGEALPPPLLTRASERFDCEIYDGIGSAEMFHIYVTNRPGDVKPGSLGKVVDGYSVLVLPRDAEGPGAEEVPDGEPGVLWVRGDSVAHGYFQDRERSWLTFHGHWCRTGDLFRRDGDGYLWFLGRADDLFKVSGIWVAPIEVEECLMAHESVAMAAVVPVVEDGLTKPKAYIVVREGVDTGAALGELLKDHVKSALSRHKYPRWVEFVADLPRNDRGKIDRNKLKAR